MKHVKWEELDWSLPDGELTRQLHCSVSCVAKHRALLGKPKVIRSRGRKQHTFDFSNADWSFVDVANARLISCPMWAVRKERMRLGLPLGKGGRKPSKTQFPHSKINWRKTDAENGRILGVSRERIRQIRAEEGLPSTMLLHKEPSWWAKINPRKTASENAERLGVGYSSILARAHKIGIILKRAPGWCAKYNWKKVDWRKSTGQLSKELGCIGVYISKRRRRHAPHTLCSPEDRQKRAVAANKAKAAKRSPKGTIRVTKQGV